MNTTNHQEPENSGYTFAEIQAEICQMFGWLHPNILIKMAASAIARLQACYQSYPIEPDALLTEQQMRAARNEGIVFCVHALSKIVNTDLHPDDMPPRDKEIHSLFIRAIREKMETPVEWVPRRNLSLADQLQLEMALWRQIRAAIQVCVLIKKMMDSASKGQGNTASSIQEQPYTPLNSAFAQSPQNGGSHPRYIPPSRQSVAPPCHSKKRR